MNQKRTKGFTLIELLAVIVILAIIALIAVPVIMNIINKANKSAFKDTAYGVISAGELYFAQQQLEPNGMTEDVTITLPDERLELKGDVPNGTITITKDGDVSISVSNGKYCATKGLEDKDVTVTECNSETPENPDTGNEYEEYAVYFNPVTNQICTDYVEANSATGVTEGCLKWYKYKTEGTKDYLILDHNTTATTAMLDFNNQTDSMLVEGFYGLLNKIVPVTLHNRLAEDTKNWTVNPRIITLEELMELIPLSESLTDEQKANPSIWYPLYQEEINNTLNDITSRIKAEDYENQEEYIEAMFEEVGKTDISMPLFMFKDTALGYISEEVGTPMGYWTNTIDLDNEIAWSMFMYMLYAEADPSDSTVLGIRPTIVLDNNVGEERQITDIITLPELTGETNIEVLEDTTSLIAVGLPIYNLDSLVYTSSNESIAIAETGIIDGINGGIVTGVSEGTATITISSPDGSIVKTVEVVVNPKPVSATDIELNTATLSIVNGGTYQLEATVLPDNATNKELTYKSSNTSVATVSSTGFITGVSGGTAIITVSTTDGSSISKTVEVTVRQIITSLELSETDITIIEGETTTVTANITPTNAYNKILKWTSSDESVATVENGTIIAVSKGEATITVSTLDGSNISKTINVNVSKLGSLSFVATDKTGVAIPNCITNGTKCAQGTLVAIKVNESKVYNFYVISETNNEVTLIMDRNLGDNLSWYDNAIDNSYGPTTAVAALKQRTSDWTNIPEREYIYSDDGGGNKYKAFTEKMRARMLTYTEATSEEIGCTAISKSCPSWLYINLYNTGIDTDSKGNEINGYWISAADANSSYHADEIYSGGYILSTYTNYDIFNGVRPVIELSK